jgi:hypothetical protein
MEHGIGKFKCATVAEAEMTASCHAEDVLLAYQPVGPNAERLVRLAKTFPNTKFSTIADDAEALGRLSADASDAGVEIEVLLDIDCGMHRRVPWAKRSNCTTNQGFQLSKMEVSMYVMGTSAIGSYSAVKSCEAAFAPVVPPTQATG